MFIPNTPLTDEEQDELSHILLFEVESDEGMTLEGLDGYLHAIAIGPTTIMPSQWLPNVLGLADGEEADWPSAGKAQRFFELLMRHYNDVVRSFHKNPVVLSPLWSYRSFEDQVYDDGEPWSFGFVQGVDLCRADWQPLFNDPNGAAWYRPIGLLGEDDFCADQHALTDTPAKREALTNEIPESVVAIHDFWLPHRVAKATERMPMHREPKIGRNLPCPCGSGKKFKKCCAV